MTTTALAPKRRTDSRPCKGSWSGTLGSCVRSKARKKGPNLRDEATRKKAIVDFIDSHWDETAAREWIRDTNEGMSKHIYKQLDDDFQGMKDIERWIKEGPDVAESAMETDTEGVQQELKDIKKSIELYRKYIKLAPHLTDDDIDEFAYKAEDEDEKYRKKPRTDDATPVKRILKWQGFEIGLQYLPFEKRHGRVLPAAYGHFRRTRGADGMAVDVYVGTNLASPLVFVVDQVIDGAFDEEKMIIGVNDAAEARMIYGQAMPKEFFGGMREISLAELEEYRVPMLTKSDAKPRRRKKGCNDDCECEPCQKARKDALEAMLKLDAKTGTPCNNQRGWVGTKPGCRRAKPGTAARVRRIERKRRGKNPEPPKARTITAAEKAERRGQLSLFPADKPQPVRSQKKKAPRGKDLAFESAYKKIPKSEEGGESLDPNAPQSFGDWVAEGKNAQHERIRNNPDDRSKWYRNADDFFISELEGYDTNKNGKVTKVEIFGEKPMPLKAAYRLATEKYNQKYGSSQKNAAKRMGQGGATLKIKEPPAEIIEAAKKKAAAGERKNLTNEFNQKIKAVRAIEDPDERARQARELAMEAEKLESRWGRDQGLSSIRKKAANLSREMFKRTKAPQPKRANTPVRLSKKQGESTLFRGPNGSYFSIDSREWDAAVDALAKVDAKKAGTPCNAQRGWVGMKKPEGKGCKRAKKGTAKRVKEVRGKRTSKKNAQPKKIAQPTDVLTPEIKKRLLAHKNRPMVSLEDISAKRKEGESIAAEVRSALKGKADPGLWLKNGLFEIADIKDFGVKDEDISSTESVDSFYKNLARQIHPDRGGSDEQMANLNDLRRQLKSISRLSSEPKKPQPKRKAKAKKKRSDAQGTLISTLPRRNGKVKYRGQWWTIDKDVPATQKGKKRQVLAKKGDRVMLIAFGDKDYRHNYSPEAKANYLNRSAGIRDKDGNLTKDDPWSPNYWSRKVLWPKGDAA